MDGNATTSSHSWTIKTKNNTEIKRYEPPPPPATLSDPFEDRLKTFIHDPTTRTMVTELHARSVTELNRRHLERQARKSNGNIAVPAQTRPKTPTEETPTTTTTTTVVEEQEPQLQQQHPYQFLDVSSLTSVDQKAWHTNIRKDTGINYPHRWLRLASLFSVQSKTLRQPSFLTPACERSALQDLDSQPSVMDNYLKIRDIQNRNYAIEAVQEGIKEFEKKNLSSAMECYKRAMDMDGKYAEAYYRVAEVMLHENKRRQALERLEYALRLDPQHEGAKALKDTLVTRKRDDRSRTGSNASRHLPRSTSRHDDHDQPRQRSKDTREKNRDDYCSRNGDEEDRESRGSSSHRTRRRRDDGMDNEEDDHKASNRHQRRSEKDEDRRSRRRREERVEQESAQRSSLGVSDHEEGRKSHRRRKRDEYEDTDRHGKRRHEQEDNDKSNTRHRHHDRSDERRQRKRRDDENRYRRQSRDRDYRRKRRHSPDRDRRSPRRRMSRSPRRRNNSSHKS